MRIDIVQLDGPDVDGPPGVWISGADAQQDLDARRHFHAAHHHGLIVIPTGGLLGGSAESPASEFHDELGALDGRAAKRR